MTSGIYMSYEGYGMTGLAQTAPFERITDFLSSPVVIIAEVIALGFVLTIWLSLAYRTYKDASRRGSAALAWGIIAVLFPFAGSLVYAIVKPADFERDRHNEELETKLLKRALSANRSGEARRETGVSGSDGSAASASHSPNFCATCANTLREEYRYCPSCGEAALTTCGDCEAEISVSHAYCPYCAKLQPQHKGIPSRSGRRYMEGKSAETPARRAANGAEKDSESRENTAGEQETRHPASNTG